MSRVLRCAPVVAMRLYVAVPLMSVTLRATVTRFTRCADDMLRRMLRDARTTAVP